MEKKKHVNIMKMNIIYTYTHNRHGTFVWRDRDLNKSCFLIDPKSSNYGHYSTLAVSRWGAVGLGHVLYVWQGFCC